MRKSSVASAVVLATLLAAAPASAAFHLWQIKEIFSSPDGSVQFIELFTQAPFENFLNLHQLTATSDGNPVVFTFDHNLPDSTANKHLLIATPGFSSLPGAVTPDYGNLPPHFFNPNAANISFSYAFGTDVLNLSGAAIPKDGVHSLTDTNLAPGGADNLVSGVNSPTNFAGATGSVIVPEPATAAIAALVTIAASQSVRRLRTHTLVRKSERRRHQILPNEWARVRES